MVVQLLPKPNNVYIALDRTFYAPRWRMEEGFSAPILHPPFLSNFFKTLYLCSKAQNLIFGENIYAEKIKNQP
jgi:hypothetical protein